MFSLYNNKENIICKSWISLLYKDHVPGIIPLPFEPRMFTMLKKSGRIDLYEQLLNTNDKNFIEFNKILEEKSGIEWYKEFSETKDETQENSNFRI